MKTLEKIYEVTLMIIAVLVVLLACFNLQDARADKLDEYDKISPFGQCDIRARMYVDGMIMRNRGAPGVMEVINGEVDNKPWVFESARDAQFYLAQAQPGWEEMNKIMLENKQRDNDNAPPEWKGKINETPYPDQYITHYVLPLMQKDCADKFGQGSQI